MAEKATTPVKTAKPAIPVKADEARLRRRDPFEMLNDLQEEMRRYWSEAWPLAPLPWRRALAGAVPTPTPWAPRVDVFERNGDLVVKAELPGVNRDDIEVTLDDGDLVIRGERKTEQEVKEDSYYRMERSYGSFQRRLSLPPGVKPDDVKASYADGVLEIRVPKPAQAPPQAQQIKIA